MTVQVRGPKPPVGGEEVPSCIGFSELWAHHAFAYEFLFWHGDRALCDWFMDQTIDLYWRESFANLRDALRRRVDLIRDQLDHFVLDPSYGQVQRKIRGIADLVMAQLDAEKPWELDPDGHDQFGRVTEGSMKLFTELVSATSLLMS